MAPKLATRLARLYLIGAAVAPTDHELSSLRSWVGAEFAQITAPIHFQNSDLDLPQTVAAFEADGILRISTAHISHPWLTAAENARFRAVHDWHHIQIAADSTLTGERATFAHACQTAPHSIHWLLFSEIVLQAAACIATGEFAAQKFVRVWGA